MGRPVSPRTGYLVLVIAAGLAIGLMIQQSAVAQRSTHPYPQQPQPQTHQHGVRPPPPALPRWEYATLRFDIVKGDWVWTSPEEVKRGDKRRLFKELGGYGKPGDHDISYVDISSQAGLYGWEIIDVVDREKGSEIWFKRPVR
jgi:hypothetical protein